MANTLPVTKTNWLSPLWHLLSLTKSSDSFALESHTLRLFRQFLALKLALPMAFPNGIAGPISFKAAVLLFVVIAAGFSRYYVFGLAAIAGLAFNDVVSTFPLTINHGVLEFCIVLLLCLMPSELPSRLSCTNMIKVLMLSVWFYSAIHKLIDGYYVNGEFFALEALANDTTLGRCLHYLVNLFGPIAAGANMLPLECCIEGPINFTAMQKGALLILSWATIVAELLLPVMVFIPRLKWLGIVGLFIAQSFIAYLSGEIDFAFTAFAILFLFLPKLAPFSYPGLAFLLLVVQPWH